MMRDVFTYRWRCCRTLGAYIVDARITTRKDGLTLDVLWIQNEDKKAITNPAELKALRKGLTDALTGMMDIDEAPPIGGFYRCHHGSAALQAPARVFVSNNASNTHTVVEINGKDAPGLLYNVTRKMADMGLQIQTASVSTYGDRVVDVFYVKDGFGLKITSEARRKKLQQMNCFKSSKYDPANQVSA